MRAAFFDMDHTVLTVNSGTLWVRYLHRRGEISRWQLLRAFGWILQYKAAVLDMETLSKRVVSEMAGASEAEMIAKCESWFEHEIAHTIAARARRVIDEHRARGERVVLLTSATQDIAEPLARRLAVDSVLCTSLEVEGGRFTGRVDEPRGGWARSGRRRARPRAPASAPASRRAGA